MIKYHSRSFYKIIFILLIYFTSINISSSDDDFIASSNCDFVSANYLEELAELKNLQKIKIEVKDYKKWIRNSLEAMVDKNPSIGPKYKRKFKAKIISIYEFGECIHDGEIRLHGDWKDHIQLQSSNSLASSLDVKLENGSISNFIKFKLFLNGTRSEREEILLTAILKEIGLIAPKTQNIEVIMNGNTIKMLIQEKAAKELLESSNRRESFIFEGDERLLFNFKNFKPFELEHLALAKINNPKLMLNGANSFNIGLEQFFGLQKAYMLHANSKLPDYLLNWKILANQSEQLISKWAHYEILLFATNSFHALRPHNRKFYYHPFYRGLEPIYFDGNTITLEGTYMRLKQDFKDYPYLQEAHFDTLISLISSIKIEDLIDQYFNEGFISKKEMQKVINDLLMKIFIIKNNYSEFMEAGITTNEVKHFNQAETKLFETNAVNELPDSQFLYIEKIKTRDEKVKIQICKIPNQKCTKDEISLEMISRVLEKKTIENLDNTFDLFIVPDTKILTSNIQSFQFDNKKIKILASKDTKISFDNISRNINFILKSNNSWALIIDSIIENVQISINGIHNKNISSDLPKERINEVGLTGCLNIFNSNINKSKIFSNTAFLTCEDSINFVRSNGTIDELKIMNSYADALDIDFSEIEILNLEIHNTGNDCVDFSSGKYHIKFATIKSCGDKGLSIGEKSTFNAKEIKILSSLIGVSSKDSSRTNIDQITISKTPLCAEAFQKKQEFSGSRLKIKTMQCKANTYNIDKNSSLEIL